MCFVNNDAEARALEFVDVREGKVEFLHRRNDDAVSLFKSFCQILGTFAYIFHCTADFFKALDFLSYVAVQHNSVSDHYNGIKHRTFAVGTLHVGKLMC